MIDRKMQALIDAPLADPVKINLPEGRQLAKRGSRIRDTGDETDGGLRLTRQQSIDRKEKAANEKLQTLFDYYAKTSHTPERIAELMGLYRHQQVGIDDKGKATFVRVLDVERVRQQIEWRRRAAA